MASTPPSDPISASVNSEGGNWRDTIKLSYRNEEAREIAKILAQLEPGASTSSKLSLALRFEDTVFQSADSLEDYRKKLTKRLKKLKKNYKPTERPSSRTNTTSKEQLFKELQQKYGESLLYIVKNASTAILDIEKRSGPQKASQLQQHTDSAESWAKELDLLKDEKSPGIPPEAQLLRLNHHLEKRVNNIRQYVVKHADPDLFLQENLVKKEENLSQRSIDILATNLVKRIQQLPNSAEEKSEKEALALLEEALEKGQTPVPPPTRNNSNEVPAALLHLDKMRAASTALMTYITMKDRKATGPRHVLDKIHTIMKESSIFINNLAKKKGVDETASASTLQLQDAWTKVFELPTSDAVDAASPPPTKKRRKGNRRLATKSQVLFRPKRRTPPNLIPALERKGATLVRPKPDGHGSHLILDFEAFTMRIFFSPLLVSLRATEQIVGDTSSTSFHITPTSGTASWQPLHQGLTNRKDGLDVWGVKNKPYDSLGTVVEERLRDASTHATHFLRKCFSNHVKDNTQEIEVEILEGSALLEFLQIARITYIPTWEDVDVL